MADRQYLAVCELWVPQPRGLRSVRVCLPSDKSGTPGVTDSLRLLVRRRGGPVEKIRAVRGNREVCGAHGLADNLAD